MNVTERINRILFIMSFVSQNQGVLLSRLADAVGMRPRQLEKELDFMLLIGKPPFRPDDYVDIYVDEESRVWIDFDQMLNRPLRFTRPEAMALLLSLELLDPEVEPDTVASLKEKIQRAISHSVDPAARLEDSVIMEHPSLPISDRFRRLRQAIDQRRKIQIEYYALMRDETSTRTIRPYALMNRLGYWYLTGYCESRHDIRTFKFERILRVEVGKAAFPQPADFDIDKYKSDFLKSKGRHQVEIFFDQAVAPWIREEWGEAARVWEQGSEKGVVLSLSSETLEFPVRLVLEYAGLARPLGPPELVEKVRRDADAVRSLYDRPVS